MMMMRTDGPQEVTSNGPFLRLTDGAGWLFETVRGRVKSSA
jgi:hypothetical protein